jgi:hypothetical protein
VTKQILPSLAALVALGAGLALARGPASPAAGSAVPQVAEQAQASLSPVGQLNTYTWSGYGEVRIAKTGRIIVLRDSGTVQAPSYQVGSALAYNAFRYGVVERSRGSLSDEVLTCTVKVTGPLP